MPRKADAITDTEEEIIWEKGVLGAINALSLNLTVSFFVPRTPSVYNRWLKFVKPDCTIQYVEWVEGPTKTCQGCLKQCLLLEEIVHFVLFRNLNFTKTNIIKEFKTPILETTQGTWTWWVVFYSASWSKQN